MTLALTLIRREQAGNSQLTRAWIERQTRQNIRQDKCSTTVIDTEAYSKFSRCQNLVALLTTTSWLYLYDLHLGKRLWSYKTRGLPYMTLSVNQDGVVLLTHRTNKKYVDVIFNGKKIGFIESDNLQIPSIRVIGDRCFGIISNYQAIKAWNLQGKPLYEYPVGPNQTTRAGFFHLLNNDRFYVQFLNNTAIVLDSEDNVTNTMIFQNDKPIQEAYLFGNKLICGLYRITTSGAFQTHRINVYDLANNRKLIHSFPIGIAGLPKHIKANDTYIVFSIENVFFATCLDTKQLYKIDSLPSLEIDAIKYVALTENLLTIIATVGAIPTRFVIDLNDGTVLQAHQYVHGHHFSFENGIHLEMKCAEKDNMIIENFYSAESNEVDGVRIKLREIRQLSSDDALILTQ